MAIIRLSGLITIKLKLDQRKTERDELLVEVNLSLWGYNDQYELGAGPPQAEGGKGRKRRPKWRREERQMSNRTEWKRWRGRGWHQSGKACLVIHRDGVRKQNSFPFLGPLGEVQSLYWERVGGKKVSELDSTIIVVSCSEKMLVEPSSRRVWLCLLNPRMTWTDTEWWAAKIQETKLDVRNLKLIQSVTKLQNRGRNQRQEPEERNIKHSKDD